MNEVKKLSELGSLVPYKLVRSFIETPDTFSQVEGMVKPEYFDDDPGLAVVVKTIQGFYQEKGKVPNYADLEYYAKRTVKDNGDYRMLYNAYKKLRESKMLDGIDTAAETAVDFIKTQETLRQLANAVTRVKKSGYSVERLTDIIEKLQGIEVGSLAEFEDPALILDRMLSESMGERVGCKISELDDHLGGGLKKGTVGLILAGTGVGKTTLMSAMSIGSAIMGKKTLFIVFEDTKEDIYRKYSSYITGRYSNDFYADSPNHDEAASELRNALKEDKEVHAAWYENLKVIRMRNADTTVDAVKNVIHRLIVQGWKPDVVYLDYLGCLKSSSDDYLAANKEFVTLDRCMKRLESFCQTENFALWVGQQLNREGNTEEGKQNAKTKVQGSFRIVQTASVVIELSRCSFADDYNRINLKVTKGRWCGEKKWECAYMNNGTCQIDLSCGEEADIFDKEEKYDY